MGILYLVATPIGNLEDITLRALRVLREADAVYAEDTRRARILLERHAVAQRPRSLHAHNETARLREILDRLAEGAQLALVSDAGTPLISDPGGRVVEAALEHGHTIVPVPGASAVLAALVAAGLPAAPFVFLGFLPRRAGPRRALLIRYQQRSETLVLFEAPRRLAGTLSDLAQQLGDRQAAVARELTKLHEEIARGSLSELAERFAGGARGEITLVVAGAPEQKTFEVAGTGETRAAVDEVSRAAQDLDTRILEWLAAGHSVREIAAALAQRGGSSKRTVYTRALVLAHSAESPKARSTEFRNRESARPPKVRQ